MSIEATRRTMEGYKTRGMDVVSPDAVYSVVTTGEESRGRDEIKKSLQGFYRESFNGKAQESSMIVGDGKACTEVLFSGTHVGDFYGLPATGKQVSFRMIVWYDIDTEKEQIQEARIYLPVQAILEQLRTD